MTLVTKWVAHKAQKKAQAEIKTLDAWKDEGQQDWNERMPMRRRSQMPRRTLEGVGNKDPFLIKRGAAFDGSSDDDGPEGGRKERPMGMPSMKKGVYNGTFKL